MKYAKFSDDFLSDFRLDDNGKTLVLTDKRGFSRAVKLLPYEERSQGEWIKDNSGDRFCSECGSCALYHEIGLIFESRFCPYCGADMRGEE